MIRLSIALGAFLLVQALSAQAAQFVSVPTDPTAIYKMIVRDLGHGPAALVVITERDGTSGVSYAIREVNCFTQRFRYMGEGETLDGAIANINDANPMAVLVEGSISYYIVQAACRST